MAKRGKKRRRAKWSIPGRKAKLSLSRGHKPVALLKLYHDKMERNLGRLENVIRRRQAAGE